MDRREFVISAAAGLAAAGVAGQTAAASHADHGGHGHHGAIDPKLTKVRVTTADCDAAAGDCIRHCIELLGDGDTSLAECLASANRMQAVVLAMNAVAASETKPSERTRELAAVCGAFCADCAKACEPHADKHAECKACLEACQTCAEACESLAG